MSIYSNLESNNLLPSEYSFLNQLEEVLQCKICQEIMSGSVILPCGHSFCSLCIRRAIKGSEQCPSCREKSFTDSILKNLDLSMICEVYRKIKNNILNNKIISIPKDGLTQKKQIVSPQKILDFATLTNSPS